MKRALLACALWLFSVPAVAQLPSIVVRSVVENARIRNVSALAQNPEVRPLAGTWFGSDWAGYQPLRSIWLGGAGMGIEHRWGRFVRTLIHFNFAGAPVEGTWARAPNESGLELSLSNIFLFEWDTGAGIYIPLGPVSPYVAASSSIGGLWMELAVRDPSRLGALGSDVVDNMVFRMSVETGVELRVDNLVVGMGVRGSFFGHIESFGGVLSLAYRAPD